MRSADIDRCDSEFRPDGPGANRGGEPAPGADAPAEAWRGRLRPSGKTFRVRGHGVPSAAGRRGDLLVTVEVAVPQRVSGKARKAVESLVKLTPSPRAHLGV